MLYSGIHPMNRSQIYALPKHINQHGELVIYLKDFASLMDMTPKEVEITRIHLVYGLSLDHDDYNLFVPKTILLSDAILIADSLS